MATLWFMTISGISIDNPNGLPELSLELRNMIHRSCGTTSPIGQTNKNGFNRYLQIGSLLIQKRVGRIWSAPWNSYCKMTAISSCLDIAHTEFMLSGRQALGEQGRTSFFGSNRMEACLLDTQEPTTSTGHLGLVAEALHPTVLRCLKWDILRSWIDGVKQCGLLIRPKLFAKEPTSTQTLHALVVAITKIR